MARNVLVAYDGSPQAEAALSLAVAEWGDETITLLTVINPVDAGYSASAGVPAGAEDWYESARGDAQELLDEAAAEFDREFETRIEVGRPSRTIVEVAEEGEFDHVVVGSHGRTGISRILLGSVAETVVRESPVPVTVTR